MTSFRNGAWFHLAMTNTSPSACSNYLSLHVMVFGGVLSIAQQCPVTIDSEGNVSKDLFLPVVPLSETLLSSKWFIGCINNKTGRSDAVDAKQGSVYTRTCFHNIVQLYREMGVQLRALVTPVSSIVEARNTFARHCTSPRLPRFSWLLLEKLRSYWITSYRQIVGKSFKVAGRRSIRTIFFLTVAEITTTYI